jgi:hypothetical protein
LCLLFTACKHLQETKKFVITDFKYSTYTWHINLDSYKWEFYLGDYFHVDSNGQFKLIRHSASLDKHQYFNGTLHDSIRQIIDSILLENKFNPEIRTDGLADTPLIIYNGFTYLVDYSILGKTRTKIQYINSSSRTPNNILFLTSFLDTVISKTKLNRINNFSIETYIDTLKKISSYNLPPPPLPPEDKIVK